MITMITMIACYKRIKIFLSNQPTRYKEKYGT